MLNLIGAVNKVFLLAKIHFIVAMLTGITWRFSLVVGYVLSIQTVGLAFDAESLKVFEQQLGLGIDLSIKELAAIVVFLFISAALLDVAYVKSRVGLENRLELQLTKKLYKSEYDDFEVVTFEKKTYCAQILIKCFDITYALVLILISVLLISFVSLTLVLALVIIAFLAGLLMLIQKKSSQKKIDSFGSKSARRRVRSQKVIRTAKVRAISTVMAGIFLSFLVIAIESNVVPNIGLVELASVAFCTRFFVSFFSLFYINLSAVSDEAIMLEEFVRM